MLAAACSHLNKQIRRTQNSSEETSFLTGIVHRVSGHRHNEKKGSGYDLCYNADIVHNLQSLNISRCKCKADNNPKYTIQAIFWRAYYASQYTLNKVLLESAKCIGKMLNHKKKAVWRDWCFKTKVFGDRGNDLWGKFRWNYFLIREENIEPTSSLTA